MPLYDHVTGQHAQVHYDSWAAGSHCQSWQRAAAGPVAWWRQCYTVCACAQVALEVGLQGTTSSMRVQQTQKQLLHVPSDSQTHQQTHALESNYKS